jgi:hypothetical protein
MCSGEEFRLSIHRSMMSRVRHLIDTLEEHPLYALMRGVARFKSVRTTVTTARSLAHHRRMQGYFRVCEARKSETAFTSIDPAAFTNELRKEGVAFGLRLPPALVEDIRRYADNALCYADRETANGFTLLRRTEAEQALGKPILLAQYFNTAEDCPAIARLSSDPALLEIAARYLQSVPTPVGVNLWWTFPVEASPEDRARHAHLFHRDVDDFRFFKFFFYLTDVSPGDGAHVCVKGSHRNPPLLRPYDQWNIRRYSDEEIGAYYPRESIAEISGNAGTGFAENTLCIHKGLTPTREPRLLLQLQYAFFDYGVAHDRRDPSVLKRIA